MGMGGREAELIKRLKADAAYPEMFGGALFRTIAPVSVDNLARAIASFERTIISGTSPFDRFRVVDDPNSITGRGPARKPAVLFHRGSAAPGVTAAPTWAVPAGYGSSLADFFNIGLYNVGGTGNNPAGGEGVFT